jgi:hypothetical protein
MEAKDLRKWAGLVGVLGGLVAILSGLLAHFREPMLGYPWRPFITVFENTAVFSAVGMLIGMGIIMVVGGLLAFRSALWGGLLVIFPAVVGLVYCYTHAWHRLDLIAYWAAPVVLAWLSGIFAGYALAKSIEPYDIEPEDDKPYRPHEGATPAS